MSAPYIPDDFNISHLIREATGGEIKSLQSAGRDEFRSTFSITLEDGRQYLLRLSRTSSVVLETEVNTMKYITKETSIPVPRILDAGFTTATDSSSTFYVLMEKIPGVALDTVFGTLSQPQQTAIVAQLAKYMFELFQHRFPTIGSITRQDDSSEEFAIGPIVTRPFYIDGRSKQPLHRGPFNSAKSYYLACAQRELDCCRVLFTQDSSLPGYQRNLEDVQLQVERCVGLLHDLITRCQGLDDDDKEMAPFSLDIHDIGLKNILVSRDDMAKIVAIVDWQFLSTKPLWSCARLPSWLRPSIFNHSNGESDRLSAIFRAEIARLDGLDSIFIRALDSDDTRQTLDDFSDYDAFKDGFLLLPALENILATLPGQEDYAALSALLDPSTLPGRVGRINLITRGSNSMFLAMSRSVSPAPPTTNQGLHEQESSPQSEVAAF
ncbi:hypothetical protein C8Q75DRAFT_782852 [Abortiporus biennis]|nr:hypothetical protein C8Q75DRAFT_782852 [Abortiporus biennis]